MSMTTKNKKKLHGFSFDNLYKNILDVEASVPPNIKREPKFRLSSSPFCPYEHVFNWIEYLDEGSTWGFQGDFYCGIGTSIHSTLQEWLPRANPGYFIGHWECDCKVPIEKRNNPCPTCYESTNPKLAQCKDCGMINHSGVGPKICPECGKFMKYKEFHFVIRPCISGHCDGILLSGETVVKVVQDLGITTENTAKMDAFLRKTKSPIEALVTEYKSGSRHKASNITEPQMEHKAQASMYVVPAGYILRNHLSFNVNVVGALIKYIARDIPQITSRDLVVPVTDTDYYMHNKRMVKHVYKAVLKDDSSFLHPKKLPCSGKYRGFYSDCSYFDSCSELRESLDEFFQKIKKPIRKSFVRFKKDFGNLYLD